MASYSGVGNIKATWTQSMTGLEDTFRKFGVSQWMVKPMRGDNRRHWESEESRVTVVFELDRHPMTLSLAEHMEHRQNLWVIWQAVEAMRMNRVRGLERVMSDAYKMLDAPADDPYALLRLARNGLTSEKLNAAYREAAALAAQDEVLLKRINIARQAILEDIAV